MAFTKTLSAAACFALVLGFVAMRTASADTEGQLLRDVVQLRCREAIGKECTGLRVETISQGTARGVPAKIVRLTAREKSQFNPKIPVCYYVMYGLGPDGSIPFLVFTPDDCDVKECYQCGQYKGPEHVTFGQKVLSYGYRGMIPSR